MTTIMNSAAVEAWLELETPVEAELVRRFKVADLGPALIDEWTTEMLANSFEDDGPGGPSNRIGRGNDAQAGSAARLRPLGL